LHRFNEAQNKQADQLPGSLAEKLQNQADVSAAFGEASSATAKLVGDISGKLAQDASKTIAALEKKAKEEGNLSPEDLASLSEARREQDLWREGGMGRALLHTLSQGVLGGIGGGNLTAALEAGGGALVSSLVGPLIADEIKKSMAASGLDDKTASNLSGLLGQILTTALTSAFGEVGASTGASVYINNYLTHKQVNDMLQKLAECADDKNCIRKVYLDYLGTSLKANKELATGCYGLESAECAAKYPDAVNALSANVLEYLLNGVVPRDQILALSAYQLAPQLALFDEQQKAQFCNGRPDCDKAWENYKTQKGLENFLDNFASNLVDMALTMRNLNPQSVFGMLLYESIVKSHGPQFAREFMQARAANWVKDGRTWWPPNDGAAGVVTKEIIQKDARLSRVSSSSPLDDVGGFFAPAGTSFEARALPNSYIALKDTEYVVLKPFEVSKAQTAPWFGNSGGGTQYKIGNIPEVTGRPTQVRDLIINGYIKF
jgi:hypothetical protein